MGYGVGSSKSSNLIRSLGGRVSCLLYIDWGRWGVVNKLTWCRPIHRYHLGAYRFQPLYESGEPYFVSPDLMASSHCMFQLVRLRCGHTAPADYRDCDFLASL